MLQLLCAGLLTLSGLSCERDLQWHRETGYRWAELRIPLLGSTGFEALAGSATGIRFLNSLSKEQIIENRHLLNGSGVALGDVDGDGLCDVYFCRLDGDNVLYRNLGNWTFEDITELAGVGCPDRFSTGAALVDIDGDFDLDLVVTALGGPNACFTNDGTGKFVEVTEEAGLASRRGRTGSTSLTFADIEGDGDLDLYITNYNRRSLKDANPIMGSSGLILSRSDYGEPDLLYLNDGTGVFTAVKLTSDIFQDESGKSIGFPRDWGLSARFQDMDGDGDPDLYVCNDFWSPDRIWINDGSGRFMTIAKQAIRHNSASTMAVDFSDIDRDGNVDFFLLDMLSRDHQKRKMQIGAMPAQQSQIGEIFDRPQIMRNTLFLNRGDGTYAEIARFSGLHASEWSWSNIFMDIDLDGFEDVLVTTGHAFDVQDTDTRNRIRDLRPGSLKELQDTIFLYPPLETPNLVFRNQRDLTFDEVGKEWGFSSIGISHGMAVGDLDNDGDLDVVVNNFGREAGLYRNKTIAARIAVRLEGLHLNTAGIGAKIRLLGGPVEQSKEMTAGGHYLSSSEAQIVFAAGEEDTDLSLEVTWRSGKRSLLEGVKPNRIYVIEETGASFPDLQPPPEPQPYFADVSHLLAHTHEETPFDDFHRQPLLPNRLSQLGPGVAWIDIDQDGDDDLLISSGRGGRLTAFRNDRSAFVRLDIAIFDSLSAYEQTAVSAARADDERATLFVGISNYENPSQGVPPAISYDLKQGRPLMSHSFDGQISTTGPISLADYDNDGDVDLFIGGRMVPGRYPEPASSAFYRNHDGRYELDIVNSALLADVGMVTSSVFSDLDSDGLAELVLATEWGPVRVFENRAGQFFEVTEAYGLNGYLGWWNGVTTADLNEDGRLDIIATNWGLNSKYHADATHPLQIFFDDFDNNGTLDIVEAHRDPLMKKIVPERGYASMSQAMPFIASRMESHERYGGSSVADILGSKFETSRTLSANTLAHMVFFNEGGKFRAAPLPAEAQFAPAFYAGAADFDGDGHDDIFITQNFFASQPETPRIDAGRGLWLRGDGKGGLEPVPGQRSGVTVYGDQRGAALADYDGDGRIDLCIAQNGAETRLYRNVRAKTGLRVRLRGPKGNLDAIGATVQLVYGEEAGPARQVHAGAGYLSQDSPVLVLGRREGLSRLRIRWPGGKLTETALPSGTYEVTVDHSGTILNRGT